MPRGGGGGARARARVCARRGARLTMCEKGGSEENSNEQAGIERMRLQLEGLFGRNEGGGRGKSGAEFDGAALRNAIRERWGVEYDVQPQKRHGRVYVQVCFGRVQIAKRAF